VPDSVLTPDIQPDDSVPSCPGAAHRYAPSVASAPTTSDIGTKGTGADLMRQTGARP